MHITVVQKAEQYLFERETTIPRTLLVWLPGYVTPYMRNDQLQQLSPQKTSAVVNSDIMFLLDDYNSFNFVLHRYQVACVEVEYFAVGRGNVKENLNVPFRDVLVSIPATPIDSVLQEEGSDLDTVYNSITSNIQQMLLPYTPEKAFRHSTAYVTKQLDVHCEIQKVITQTVRNYSYLSYNVSVAKNPILELVLYAFQKVDYDINSIGVSVLSIPETVLTLYVDEYFQCSGFILQSEISKYINDYLYMRFGQKRKDISVTKIQIPAEFIHTYMRVITQLTTPNLLL